MEVPHEVDPINEHAAQQLKIVRRAKLKSVAKEGSDLDDEKRRRSSRNSRRRLGL
jgi:hypothetical protein